MVRFVSRAPRAQELAAALDRAAPLAGCDDLCLVLGGDGTMLGAIRAHGTSFRYLGLNSGTLGFLMNDVAGPPDEVIDRVRDGLAAGLTSLPAPRLLMCATGASGESTALAVNDVYVERQSGQTCHLRVRVDDVLVVDQMAADGVICATPLGSTAYNFSAGGTAAHPRIRGLQLTTICPHRPRLAPILLPATSRVRVQVLDHVRRPARAVADGQSFGDVTDVVVEASGDDVRLCFLPGHDFTQTMIRKILQP
jgi:NAD+ kinase